MSKISWDEMMQEYPRAYFVVGVPSASEDPADRIDTLDAKPRMNLVERLAKFLALRGSYAVTVSRQRDGAHVHVALADFEDAEKLARALNAGQLSSFSGGATRRIFSFDEKTYEGIAAVLEQDSKRQY